MCGMSLLSILLSSACFATLTPSCWTDLSDVAKHEILDRFKEQDDCLLALLEIQKVRISHSSKTFHDFGVPPCKARYSRPGFCQARVIWSRSAMLSPEQTVLLADKVPASSQARCSYRPRLPATGATVLGCFRIMSSNEISSVRASHAKVVNLSIPDAVFARIENGHQHDDRCANFKFLRYDPSCLFVVSSHLGGTQPDSRVIGEPLSLTRLELSEMLYVVLGVGEYNKNRDERYLVPIKGLDSFKTSVGRDFRDATQAITEGKVVIEGGRK